MTTTASGVYINLPVRDLDASIRFFSALGFAFNAQFTDATAACMELGPNMAVMLLTHDKFASFSPRPVADAHRSTEVLICIALRGRREIDELVTRAVAAGGSTFSPPQDHGFMYHHSFQDLDGHVWELMFMDMAAMPAEGG